MARQPRRLAGIGAADIPDAAAFDAYVGPPREVTVDPVRLLMRLHDGSTPGGNDVGGGGGGGSAEETTYDNAASGLTATNVQEAVDELAQSAGGISANLLRGYISGLGLSNNPITPNTMVDVAAGVANADDASLMMELSAGTINLSTVGANGLDAGSLAANTWYHVFAIAQADGTTSRIASLSPVAPTLPSGYVKRRRLGSVRTNASSQIVAFKQMGRKFLWSVPVCDYQQLNPGTAAVLPSLTVPSGVQVDALVWFYLQTGDGARRTALITSPDQADTPASDGVMSSAASGIGTTNGNMQAEYTVRTNVSRQIRFRLATSGAQTSVIITTPGWIDYL
jgi:hypothetical protein